MRWVMKHGLGSHGTQPRHDQLVLLVLQLLPLLIACSLSLSLPCLNKKLHEHQPQDMHTPSVFVNRKHTNTHALIERDKTHLPLFGFKKIRILSRLLAVVPFAPRTRPSLGARALPPPHGICHPARRVADPLRGCCVPSSFLPDSPSRVWCVGG